ncbi:MAG: hypothetical protein ACLTH0_13905, partial [Blautia producta]
MKCKIILSVILACSIFTCFGLCGCSQKSGENSLFKEQLNREGKTEKQSDYLVYYTIGTPDPDLELVTQEINQV